MEKINFSRNAITTEEELREIIGEPHELVVKKSISFLDEHCKKLISMSPLLFLSTANAEGNCDVSPRGDLPGTINILNKNQLVIPDRPGNKRLDSILNIISNPNVGLVFLIPGLEEVLRINGRATVFNDKEVLEKMSLKGKAPLLGIGIDVEECFIHCPRALKESNIWKPTSWQDIGNVPSIMKIFTDHLKLNGVEVKE
ncbi:pyridoxamine 5'-phosphate oxidase family protein [Anaerobacillus alkaliphilus]|uniref:Pyridoxamine 5'-phosphate oxidase family protein n=1 Tax=Anaerobacillus alkaliphilus TaxID=1548597 RepID=A0A4Q0VT92_9BACI|nr:MSMEG_1061 family FMN-dependent PPOX-type flavoprotein [Anaerobacillus alkaliphilus]RXJ00638.1 pyridoxamine 5'-phosphate oxidase family protein [Anaerobacillus alkaliphilus]